MGVSVTFVMFVAALCLLDKSVLCDEIQGKADADTDDDAEIDLLTTVIDAARMVKPGTRVTEYDALNMKCIPYVEKLNVEGVEEDSMITSCLVECFLNQNEYGKQIFNEETVPHKECIMPREFSIETALARDLPQKRWKWGRKVVGWVKKNGPKIVKGIQIAGKIIKGIVGLFGGK